MSAKELLNALGLLDVQLVAIGDRLRIDGPKEALTEELLQRIREHKSQILQILQGQSQNNLSSSSSDLTNLDQVASMELDRFAQAGLVVKVWSATLNGHVLFVSDNVCEKELRDAKLPVYRASEMRKLAILRPKPRALRQIHDVKTIFNGNISDVISADQ